jgi:D-arabinose 1-dehydrogenase-like Zn-dependent alcohol dehydrogenase
VSTLPGILKDNRVLVLQAHDGAGMLAAQELVAAGARVTVQIATEDLLETLRGLKLEAVKIGAPQAVLQALDEDDSFDAIIDTVGGKDMWEACKKVIANEGQVRIHSSILYVITSAETDSVAVHNDRRRFCPCCPVPQRTHEEQHAIIKVSFQEERWSLCRIRVGVAFSRGRS